MSKRLVIVGGVAAGASAAAKARRTDEDIDIVMCEAGPYMSFANCGLPYYVGGEIASRDALFVAHPERFRDRFRVDVRLNTRVMAVDAKAQQVALGDATLAYDRLVLATGTVPVMPPIEGLDAANVFLCREIADVDAIHDFLERVQPRDMEGLRGVDRDRFLGAQDAGVHALIVGGGYIGLECAEQLIGRGVRVTVVEAATQVMAPLDPEMTQPIVQALMDAGAEVILNDGVERLEPTETHAHATLASGREIPFDLAIVGAGVRPNVALAEDAGVTLGATGAIAVDVHQRTSDAAIFAGGDNCESVFGPTGEAVNIHLAGPANKHGRVAGQNAALDLAGAAADDPRRLRMGAILGTSIVRVCGVTAGATGLTEKAARAAGLDAATIYHLGAHHAGYYPGAALMGIKLVFARDDGRLLGAQAVGRDGVDKRIDVYATALQAGMTVAELEDLDLAYAPPFGAARDVAMMAGMVAANAWRGLSPGVGPLAAFAELDAPAPPLLIDVRSPREYAAGQLDGAVNIPWEELRGRLDEVPRDRPVIVHCNAGYRSYCAQQVLRAHGYDNVRNLQGGYGVASRGRGLAG